MTVRFDVNFATAADMALVSPVCRIAGIFMAVAR